MRLQPPAPLENRARQVRGRFRRSLRDNGAALRRRTCSQSIAGQPSGWPARASRTVGRGSHPKDRSAAQDPRSGLTARDRPCVVNALRAQRGPYPVAPPTGLNPPTPLSGEPQFCPQILRKTRTHKGTIGCLLGVRVP